MEKRYWLSSYRYSAFVESNKILKAWYSYLLLFSSACWLFWIIICLIVYLFFGANSPKFNIEDVTSNSKASTPKYKILREPPQGRPEFLVIETLLPGIVSMQVQMKIIKCGLTVDNLQSHWAIKLSLYCTTKSGCRTVISVWQ